MKHWVRTLAASAVCCGIAASAAAQSAYGCEDLDGFHALPAVEGSNGVFFRVDPELKNFHAFSDETVADVARLSQELAQHGTQLVYMPIPPKAMVLTEQLPRRAYDYGFEPNLAASVYDDMVMRLRQAGVTVADARSTLSAGIHGASLPYFATDYRLTGHGARLAAQSVAQALNGGDASAVSAAGFARGPSGQMAIDSDMRAILQRHCLIKLPEAVTDVFGDMNAQTAALSEPAQVQQPTTQAAPAAQPNRFLQARPRFLPPRPKERQTDVAQEVQAAEAQPIEPARAVGMTQTKMGAKIALVGTEYSATPGIGFAEALESATGMPVEQLSLSGGGAFGAFSAYVTSDAFQQNRPDVIVWENPVYNNLAQFGDQPMRELIAAASGACSLQLPALASLDGQGASVDLSSLNPREDYTLYFDTGGSDARVAQFLFQSAQGFVRTKTVVRNHPDARTGRFYVPLTGLWPEGARSVEIRVGGTMAATPRVSACQY